MIDHALDAPQSNQSGTLRLADLAAISCWSQEHLVRAWRDVFGAPPMASLRRIQLELSQTALRQGHSVSAVAAHSGYATVQAFSHAFSRTFGCTPTQFRNRPAPATKEPRLIRLDDPLRCHAMPPASNQSSRAERFDALIGLVTRSDNCSAPCRMVSLDWSAPVDGQAFHAAVIGALDAEVAGKLVPVWIPAGHYISTDVRGRIDGWMPDQLRPPFGSRDWDRPVVRHFLSDPWRNLPSERAERIWIPVRVPASRLCEAGPPEAFHRNDASAMNADR